VRYSQLAGLAGAHNMARDFEDHCWRDIVDADTIQIYQAYRRKIYVGDNAAVLAIDLYNKAYRGGDRPVKEGDRGFFGSCGAHARKEMEPTPALVASPSGRRWRRLRHCSRPRAAQACRSSTPPVMRIAAACTPPTATSAARRTT